MKKILNYITIIADWGVFLIAIGEIVEFAEKRFKEVQAKRGNVVESKTIEND